MKLTKLAILTSFRSKADGSVSITFTTALEVRSDEVGEIHSMMNTHGILYFRGDEKINEKELEELDNIELDLYDNKKTQSQRLRAVLFLRWKQEGEKGDFKEFYRIETEKVITHWKGMLPDE